jgi:hypothetical protein
MQRTPIPRRSRPRLRGAALALAAVSAMAAAPRSALAQARPAPRTAPAAAAAAAPAPLPPLPIGTRAPDFALPAVTRYGPLARPVTPADFLGKTLVIAFFYQARTKG